MSDSADTSSPAGPSPPSGGIRGSTWRVRVLSLTVAVLAAGACVCGVRVYRFRCPWQRVLVIPTPKPKSGFGGCMYPTSHSCFSPDGRKVLVSRLENVAEIWDVGRKRPVQTLRAASPPQGGDRGEVWDIAWSPDGRFLTTQTGELEGLYVWDAATGRRAWTWKQKAGPSRVAFPPDGSKLALAPRVGGFLGIFATETGKLLHKLKFVDSWGGLIWSADSRYVASGGEMTVQVWDAETGKECFEHTGLDCRLPWPYFIDFNDPTYQSREAFQGRQKAIAFLPDASALIVFYSGYSGPAYAGSMLLPDPSSVEQAAAMANMNRIRAYAVPSGDLLWDVPVPERIENGAVSPDGSLMATAAHLGPLAIRRIGRSEVIQRIELDRECPGAVSVTWTPDGRCLLARDSWVYDGSTRIRVCLPDHDVPVAVLKGPRNEMVNFSASPDGRRILATDSEMTTYVWERKFQETPLGLLGRWELWGLLASLVGLTWMAMEAGRRIGRPAGPARVPPVLLAGLYLLAAIGVADLAARAIQVIAEDYFAGFNWDFWGVSRKLGWPGMLVLNLVAYTMVLRLRRGWRRYVICVLTLAVLCGGYLVLRALPAVVTGRVAWTRSVATEVFTVPIHLPGWLLLLPWALCLTTVVLVWVNLLRPSVRVLFKRAPAAG